MAKLPVPLLLVGAGAAALLFAGGRKRGGGGRAVGVPYSPPQPSSPGMRGVRDQAQRVVDLGAPDWFVDMALLQAASESRGNNLVGLGVPYLFPRWAEPNLKASENLQRGETEAAENIFARNREKYDQSPYPQEMWTFGSGGYYGLLPGSALGWSRDATDMNRALRPGLVHPYDVFDPFRSTVYYAAYVRGIMRNNAYQNLPPQHQNAYAIKRGGAALSLISDYQESKDRSKKIRERMDSRATFAGVSPAFLTKRLRLSDWGDWPGVYEVLRRGERLVPGYILPSAIPPNWGTQDQAPDPDAGSAPPVQTYPVDSTRSDFYIDQYLTPALVDQFGSIAEVTDYIFEISQTACPMPLNPNDPAQQECVSEWLRIQNEVARRIEQF